VTDRNRTDDARHGAHRARPRANPASTDADLIEAFVSWRDEGAFSALVERHGPMVLRVCRQLLRDDAHDAEDAFQAVFLVLVRKAGSIRERGLLGNWLYGVAHRVAARMQAVTARRRRREGQGGAMADVEAGGEPRPSDLQPVLHEEVNRLPDRYRVPVVLCYLEGKSNEEVARALHRPVGTIKGRLARARKLLRARLTRRGLALTTGLLAAALAENTAAAAPPPAALRAVTVKAAMRFAAGRTAPGGSVSPRVAALTNGVLRSLRLGELRPIAIVGLAALGLIVLVICLLLLPRGARQPATAAKEDDAKARPVPAAPREEGDEKKLQGDWRMAGVVSNGVRTPIVGLGGTVWSFQGEQIILRLDGQVVAHFAYKLAPDQKPKAIDVTLTDERGRPQGKPEPWIYELDGDTLRLCKPIPIEGKTARPNELASKPGSNTMLMELKRQPAGHEKGGARK
jgi:RNA polymerase sigma factor (sigma-70 family)